MCAMDYQPVDGHAGPCGSCPDYLSVCSPVIYGGLLAGAECDLSACGSCRLTDCPERDGV